MVCSTSTEITKTYWAVWTITFRWTGVFGFSSICTLSHVRHAYISCRRPVARSSPVSSRGVNMFWQLLQNLTGMIPECQVFSVRERIWWGTKKWSILTVKRTLVREFTGCPYGREKFSNRICCQFFNLQLLLKATPFLNCILGIRQLWEARLE